MVDGKGQGPARAGGASTANLGNQPGQGRIICFGGAAIDRKYVAHRAIMAGTSNPATGSLGFGGVARNVAANLARLGVDTSLVSIVGDDPDGRALIGHLGDLGIEFEGVRVAAGQRTAEYVALLDPERSLAAGISAMVILDGLELDDLSRSLSRLGTADWIFADGNLPATVLSGLLEDDLRASAKVAVDPVSAPKAERLPRNLSGIDLLFLNLDEAAGVLGTRLQTLSTESAVLGLRDRGAREIVLTLGAQGLALCDVDGQVSYVASVPADVVDVTGAGDALIAATLAGRLAGASLPEACRMGTLAAALTLEQEGSTHSGLSRKALTEAAGRLPSRLQRSRQQC